MKEVKHIHNSFITLPPEVFLGSTSLKHFRAREGENHFKNMAVKMHFLQHILRKVWHFYQQLRHFKAKFVL